MWPWSRKPRDAGSPPQFRFHPGAYERSFEVSDAHCDICRQPAGWLYTNNVYARGEVQICAWCIADGSLRRHCRDPHVGFHDMQHEDVAAAIAEELMLRTPGFSTFNPFQWPVRDGMPMAFIGYGDETHLWKDPDVQAAMTAAFGEPVPKGSGYALVFSDVDGPAYHVEIDLD